MCAGMKLPIHHTPRLRVCRMSMSLYGIAAIRQIQCWKRTGSILPILCETTTSRKEFVPRLNSQSEILERGYSVE